MISKKELLEKIYAIGNADNVNQGVELLEWANSLPDDQPDDAQEPAGEAYYPGSYYQPLFDHMSQNHNLTLLQGDMDEIIRVVRKMDEPALLPFQWPVPDGVEVVTRDGRKLGQLTKYEGAEKDCFAGVIQGNKHISCWYNDGMYAHPISNENDLFLRRKEKKVWVVDMGNTVWCVYEDKPDLNLNATTYEATLKPVVMPPKEKAKEIAEKMERTITGTLIGGITTAAKRCALIAVEEIIDAIEIYGYSGTFYDDPETGEMVCNDKKSPVDYWNQVKTEIENL